MPTSRGLGYRPPGPALASTIQSVNSRVIRALLIDIVTHVPDAFAIAKDQLLRGKTMRHIESEKIVEAHSYLQKFEQVPPGGHNGDWDILEAIRCSDILEGRQGPFEPCRKRYPYEPSESEDSGNCDYCDDSDDDADHNAESLRTVKLETDPEPGESLVSISTSSATHGSATRPQLGSPIRLKRKQNSTNWVKCNQTLDADDNKGSDSTYDPDSLEPNCTMARGNWYANVDGPQDRLVSAAKRPRWS